MIGRDKLALVQWHLRELDSVVLLGPRQVGKTTLALEIVGELGEGAIYLDLESPNDREKLIDPEAFFNDNPERLVVLDEVQRLPDIFEVLRGQIDARRRNGSKGKFLILGSASLDLLQQSSETLAGRISYVELGPLTLTELLNDADTSTTALTSDAIQPDIGEAAVADIANQEKNHIEPLVNRLWLKGGFPDSFTPDRDLVSLTWRVNFIRTYLERDLPSFGIRVGSDQLNRFWRLLASDQGAIFVSQRYARDLGVTGHAIARYLEILRQLLLVRELLPWAVNGRKRLVKKPKVYIRDSGILHALLNIRTLADLRSHTIVGASWEGFVIEALIDAAGDNVSPFFYRSQVGAEIDLVLEIAPGRVWAIEIKLGERPKISRGFETAADDIMAERRIVVCTASDRYLLKGYIEVMPLLDAVREIQAIEVEENEH